ncbi:diguanylate cyclase [Pseudomonadota bacterium]
MSQEDSQNAEGGPVPVMPQEILDGISGIESAISQQTDWFKSWHENVVCNHDSSAFNVKTVADIPMGAWFQGDESKAFRNNPGFLLLGQKLELMLEQVTEFLSDPKEREPRSVDDYTEFMSTLMEMNNQVQHLQNDAWRGLTKMDPLTGVRNRHDMMVDLDSERERARRSAQACAVAMVDLDHFKVLNDTHGHVVGDQVLRHVSRVFGEQLRPYDRVYRYGGEEFLLCLPNTDMRTAVMVLGRLREAIAESPMPYAADGSDIFVTASFGVAEIDTVEHIVKTIERADDALYEVKRDGRNAVKGWNPANL